MENNDSQKFELIASILHGEETDQIQEVSEITDMDLDFISSKRVFDLKEQVMHLRRLSPENEVWEKIKPRISPRPAIKWPRWLSYAAVFIGAVLLSTAFHIFYSDSGGIESETFAIVSSPRGQITNLTLFDGTTVWLNSGSTLKYSNQFGRSQREVSLDGEALFEVQKGLRKSFVVNMGESKIVVHGTVFNAKNYNGEKEVVLIEGKIEYLKKEKDIFLRPNDRITEDKNTGEMKVDQVVASTYSAWIGGKAYFDSKSLEDLSQLMERWYDVEFVFEKQNIKSYKFSGVINKDRSLDYALSIIQLTNKVKFRKERDKIIITE